MVPTETYDAIRKLLAVNCAVDPASVLPETRLASLGIDSLKLLEIIFALEEALGVQIAADDLMGITTVHELVDHLERLRSP